MTSVHVLGSPTVTKPELSLKSQSASTSYFSPMSLEQVLPAVVRFSLAENPSSAPSSLPSSLLLRGLLRTKTLGCECLLTHASLGTAASSRTSQVLCQTSSSLLAQLRYLSTASPGAAQGSEDSFSYTLGVSCFEHLLPDRAGHGRTTATEVSTAARPSLGSLGWANGCLTEPPAPCMGGGTGAWGDLTSPGRQSWAGLRWWGEEV